MMVKALNCVRSDQQMIPRAVRPPAAGDRQRDIPGPAPGLHVRLRQTRLLPRAYVVVVEEVEGGGVRDIG